MPATAAPVAPLPRRRRVYATVDPRYEWARTEHEDTLDVDVSGNVAALCLDRLLTARFSKVLCTILSRNGLVCSGFRKEELRVLYSTNRKLKVTGERQVDGAQWARFAKVFPVPKSCDSSAIRARMNIDTSRLSVVLPKRSPSSSSTDKQNEPQTMGEHKGQGSAGGSSGSSSGSLYSAQEDPGKDMVEEKEQREQRPKAMAVQDSPKGNDGDANVVPRDHEDANAAGRDDGDDKGESKKWWRKIRVIHVLGFVLILALVGVGATLLYVMLL